MALLYGAAGGAWFVWMAILIRHENRVRAGYRARCMFQGVDWEWAHPNEYGASLLFSVPQPRNLRTGAIEWTPLLT